MEIRNYTSISLPHFNIQIHTLFLNNKQSCGIDGEIVLKNTFQRDLKCCRFIVLTYFYKPWQANFIWMQTRTKNSSADDILQIKLFFKMSHALKNVCVILLYVQTFAVKCVFARLWKHTCLGCMRVRDCAMIHAWCLERKSRGIPLKTLPRSKLPIFLFHAGIYEGGNYHVFPQLCVRLVSRMTPHLLFSSISPFQEQHTHQPL